MNAELQLWLALEHEAVWLYPVIGARFSALEGQSRKSYNAHLTARDRLIALVANPVATGLTYDVGRLHSKDDARKVARGLEARIAAACLTVVGDTARRNFATAALQRAALAELAWGGQPSAFPGLP